MRRFFPLLLLCVLASPASAAPALVQASSFGRTTSGFSTTFSWTPTTGNAVLVTVGFFNSQNAELTVTDNKSNTYNLVTNTHLPISTVATCDTFLALNITGGSTTITVTSVSHTGFFSCSIHEISGVATSSAVDQSSGLVDTGATPWGGTAITTTNASDYLYSSIYDYTSTANPAAGAGYTEPAGVEYDNTDGETISSAYQVVSATGTYQCNWTSAHSSAVVQIALKAAAGGGGGATLFRRGGSRRAAGSRSARIPDVKREDQYAFV